MLFFFSSNTLYLFFCVYNITGVQNFPVQNHQGIAMAWKTSPPPRFEQGLRQLWAAQGETLGQCLHEERTMLFHLCNRVTAPPTPAHLILRLEVFIVKVVLNGQITEVKGNTEQCLGNQPHTQPSLLLPFFLEQTGLPSWQPMFT